MTPSGPVLARLDRPRAANTRLAVVADPHVAAGQTGTWKVYHRTAERFAAALRDAAAIDADAVVLPGDLTRDGHPDEFERADAMLASTEVPFLAVPGNHDVPKATDDHETPSVATFADRYADGGFPVVREVGGLTVVGVNTAGADDRLTDTHEGGLTTDQVGRVDDVLAATDGPAVVVGHHPLAGPADHESAVSPAPLHPPMESAADLSAVLRRHDVALAVTGHNHWPALADLGGTWELAAPAACSLPPTMLVLDVTPAGTTVSLVPLADRDGLEEAYRHAAAGSERARAIAERVAAGHLDAMPLVDCHGGPDTRNAADLTRGSLVD